MVEESKSQNLVARAAPFVHRFVLESNYPALEKFLEKKDEFPVDTPLDNLNRTGLILFCLNGNKKGIGIMLKYGASLKT